MINEELSQRGYSCPLLKCVTVKQVAYVIQELHEKVCEYHFGVRIMTIRILRAGYFWPIMEEDYTTYVKNASHAKNMATLSTTNKNHCTMSLHHGFFQMGNKHHLSLHTKKRSSQISLGRDRLLLQMDWTRASSDHHDTTCTTFYVEEYRLQIRGPSHHHHRQ